MTKRDLRVAGRTRATITSLVPARPEVPTTSLSHPSFAGEPEEEAGLPTAKVIPLPVFDARKEAELWRY